MRQLVLNPLFRRILSVVLVVLILDQTLKIWVKLHMVYRDSIPLLGEWFELFFVENEGMAFGMKIEGDWGKLALSLFRVLAVVAIGWYLRNLIKKKAHKGLITAIAFIFAGALGNIIDSMFYGMFFTQSSEFTDEIATVGTGYASDKPMGGFLYGSVVDMLRIKLTWPDWVPWLGGGDVFGPIFNIADVSISVGVVLIIIKQRTYFGKKKKKDEASDEAAEAIAEGEDAPVSDAPEAKTEVEATEASDSSPPEADADPVKAEPKPEVDKAEGDANEDSESL